MALSRIIAVVTLAALLLPLLFVQAQEPKKDPTVTQLLNKYRKDAFSSKLEDRRNAFEGFYQYSRNLNAVVTNLETGLGDPDEEIRNKAAMALAQIGPSANL